MTTQATGEHTGTVANLRQRHSLLLQRSSSRNPRDLSKDEILTFLDEVVASGRVIASEQGREAAEGILDYWVGRLLAQDRSSYQVLSSYYLDEYAGGEEGTGDLDEAEKSARELEALKAKAADITKNSLEEDREGRSMRATLLELFRLPQGSRKPELSPLSQQADAMQDRGIQKAVARLLELGLIREVGEGESAGYVLAREELLKEWPALRHLVSERVALRDLANGWDKGGQKKSLLLNDSAQLAAAGSYTDLSKVETLFINESRARVDAYAERQKNLTILGAVLGAATLIMLGIWCQHTFAMGGNLKGARGQVEVLEGKLRQMEGDYSRLNRKLELLSADLGTAKYDLDRTKDRALLNAWSSDFRLKEAEAMRGKIGEISKELEKLPELPPKVSQLLPPPDPSGTGNQPPSAAITDSIVEFYVPDAADAEDAAVFLNSLEEKGATNPWREALVRKGPPDITEVRYYHEEDKLRADQVVESLKAEGFERELNIKLSNNGLIPKRFIIVSFAPGAAAARNEGAPMIWVRRHLPGQILERPLAGDEAWAWDGKENTNAAKAAIRIAYTGDPSIDPFAISAADSKEEDEENEASPEDVRKGMGNLFEREQLKRKEIERFHEKIRDGVTSSK